MRNGLPGSKDVFGQFNQEFERDRKIVRSGIKAVFGLVGCFFVVFFVAAVVIGVLAWNSSRNLKVNTDDGIPVYTVQGKRFIVGPDGRMVPLDK